jgi:hypothetical protein
MILSITFKLLVTLVSISMVLCLFQTVDSQQQLLRFLSLFAGGVCLVSSYAWFGQQVINEVGCMISRLCLKCEGTRAETRFRLSAKRTSLFKSAGVSVQSTTGRRAVHISLQGLYCSCKPVFCSHVTLTGYPLHFLVSPSLLLPCVTVCHHSSTVLPYLYIHNTVGSSYK